MTAKGAQSLSLPAIAQDHVLEGGAIGVEQARDAVCVCDIGLKVEDGRATVERARALGAEPFEQQVGPGDLRGKSRPKR